MCGRLLMMNTGVQYLTLPMLPAFLNTLRKMDTYQLAWVNCFIQGLQVAMMMKHIPGVLKACLTFMQVKKIVWPIIHHGTNLTSQTITLWTDNAVSVLQPLKQNRSSGDTRPFFVGVGFHIFYFIVHQNI